MTAEPSFSHELQNQSQEFLHKGQFLNSENSQDKSDPMMISGSLFSISS